MTIKGKIIKKERNLVYSQFPSFIAVCDGRKTPTSLETELSELKVYANIYTKTVETGGIWITQYRFAGDIKWMDNHKELTTEQISDIVALANKFAEADKGNIHAALVTQEIQRKKYADVASIFNEW